MILFGWWVPLVPSLLVLVLNGAGLATALFYRHQQNVRLRLTERLLVLKHTTDTVHNGPLQTLAEILREEQHAATSPQLLKLQQLDQELRTILYEELPAICTVAQRDLLDEGNPLRLGDRELDLSAPLHELLHQVYRSTLERQFACFKTIVIKVVQVDPLDDQYLRLEHKRGLCRFLEEALCNVGKYVTGATRLEVVCRQEGSQQVIQVADNGIGLAERKENGRTQGQEIPSAQPTSLPRDPVRILKELGRFKNSSKPGSGLGTRQAETLAKQLGGTFRRHSKKPKGTVCKFVWSAKRIRFWSR